MPTNTIVLIIVTALAVLVLAGVLVWVTYRTRASRRHPTAMTIRDEIRRESAFCSGRDRHQNDPGAQPATASRGLSKRSTASPDQPNELRDSADTLGAALASFRR
jgi:hypothetical protein